MHSQMTDTDKNDLDHNFYSHDMMLLHN